MPEYAVDNESLRLLGNLPNATQPFINSTSPSLSLPVRISVIFRVRSAKAVKITDASLLKRLGILCGGESN